MLPEKFLSSGNENMMVPYHIGFSLMLVDGREFYNRLWTIITINNDSLLQSDRVREPNERFEHKVLPNNIESASFHG